MEKHFSVSVPRDKDFLSLCAQSSTATRTVLVPSIDFENTNKAIQPIAKAKQIQE